MRNDVSNGPNQLLLHFHVCIHCGSAFRREDFEDWAHTTGIYPCLECGVEGPLNIEIRAIDKLERISST